MKKQWLVGMLLVLVAGCDAVLGIDQAPALQEDQDCRTWTCTGQTCGYVKSKEQGDKCSNDGQCDDNGACKAKLGDQCVEGSDCAYGFCAGNVCCDGVCNGPGETCGGDGHCKFVDGHPCSDGSSCLSGNCVDDACCNDECSGTCMSCNLPGAAGKCLKVPSGQQDPTGAKTCNGSGETCDGSGNCKLVNGNSCGSPSNCFSGNCVDGVCCNEPCMGTCKACNLNGNFGTCSNIGFGSDDTNSVPGCAAIGQSCDGSGYCKKDLGQQCSTASECLSGNCADGVCCETACDGTCMACAPDNGLCQPIGINLDPQNECSNGACGGNGKCKRDIGQTCTADGDCLTNACQGGVCTGPSCAGVAATCGSQKNESCCASPPVQGGLFYRSRDANYPATVSDFHLDKFEVTVGRFRKFVEAYPGSKPIANAGAHPKIPDSGWNTAWDSTLPADQAGLITNVKQCSIHTWTDTVLANETLPMDCVSWSVAFAFCAWDGGRLPTEAEWNYAAANGSNDYFPWSFSMYDIDSSRAVYGCASDGDAATCVLADILPVGSKPSGNGGGKQADMAGSLWEWNLDYYGAYPTPCIDCAQLANQGASKRVLRGGSWRSMYDQNSQTVPALLTTTRFTYSGVIVSDMVGLRCARTP